MQINQVQAQFYLIIRQHKTCLDKDFKDLIVNEEDSDSNNSDYDITCNTNKLAEERTPTERHIIKKIEQKRSIIHSLREKLQETESKLEQVKSDPCDGNVCRNCHWQLGHTSRSCDYGKCTWVFKCGMEKFHPGEHNIKDLRSQLKKHERELEKLIEELKCKKKRSQRCQRQGSSQNRK
ncbi:Hypothetical predicted protein [Paramuricea clavata]|uniref:Uncharacterized protein n=1 Tax=Paramuricea clavata TaxID=317549 RepID=A0A7D9K761_PARCT|nr:Hypothetical predicted protein [Paramuricea clavata]